MSERSDGLTHMDEAGRPRMVDVGAKEITSRRAIARGRLQLSAPGWEALSQGGHPGKGDPLTTAQVAAVQAAKRCCWARRKCWNSRSRSA
jgi:cyclic pyranopterin phosphate synthase